MLHFHPAESAHIMLCEGRNQMLFQNGRFDDRIRYFASIVQRGPAAAAKVIGSDEYPAVNGKVYFYQTKFGTLVAAQIFGLPVDGGGCRKRIFAFHIHSGGSCTGDMDDPFADAMTHYNPNGCDHPYHAGDLPPLFGNSGYAAEAFLTDRFSVQEVIGRTVIIHSSPDDFTTQPSGNSGEKIACGKIERARRV